MMHNVFCPNHDAIFNECPVRGCFAHLPALCGLTGVLEILMDDLVQWYRKGWERWSDYEGRSRRKEYWVFLIVNLVALWAIGYLEGGLLGTWIFRLLASFAIAVAFVSLSVRRLHDIGQTGLLALLLLTGIGTVVLLVLACLDSQGGANKYGAQPKRW